jgi:hypothetical protein
MLSKRVRRWTVEIMARAIEGKRIRRRFYLPVLIGVVFIGVCAYGTDGASGSDMGSGSDGGTTYTLMGENAAPYIDDENPTAVSLMAYSLLEEGANDKLASIYHEEASDEWVKQEILTGARMHCGGGQIYEDFTCKDGS